MPLALLPCHGPLRGPRQDGTHGIASDLDAREEIPGPRFAAPRASGAHRSCARARSADPGERSSAALSRKYGRRLVSEQPDDQVLLHPRIEPPRFSTTAP